MVGVFPPPDHGQSLSNQALREHLVCGGAAPLVVDLSPDSASRSWHVRLGRSLRVVRGLVRYVALLVSSRGGSVVISMSGGFGLAYELVFVALARGFRRTLFLHHHNYTYLDSPSSLMRAMTRTAGPRATHIVLCERMGAALKRTYASVRETVALSNVVFLEGEGDETDPRERLAALGYLSNITAEKGIFEFLDTLDELDRRGVPVRASIAGPIEDAGLRSQVLARVERLAGTRYVGARYGPEKNAFYRSLDLLLFPSRNEAEGRVIHEAMRTGAPVIAPGRGCIPDVIGEDGGLVVDPRADFARVAADRIEAWVRDPAEFEAVSRAAALRCARSRRETRRRLDALGLRIMNG